MDDIGQRLVAVLVDIVHAEALGQQHIDLNGDKGVLLAVHILILNIQLRAVERGLVDAHGVVHVQVLQDALHDGLCVIPLLRRTLVLVVGVGGIPLGEAERTLIQQTHSTQAVLGQIEALLELLLQLVGTQHQMALGDGELADADQTVHLAGILVAEQGGRLAQAHGQVAVAAAPVQEDLILERAGHGTQGKALLRLVHGVTHDEHTVQIVIPVAGDLIQLALGHQGRLGQQIASLLLGVLHPALQQLDDPCALGQQDGQALTDAVHCGEILQLAAQLVVVALQRVLTLLEIRLQLVLIGERHAVDTLELLAAGIAAPVGGVAGGELDAVALDAARGVHVRAGAQVHELALLVEGDMGILRQVVDKLHLVGLFLLLHILDGLGAGQLEALQLQLLLADLPHLRLDLRQVLRREGEGRVQVVIEAVVDGRADGQLHLRPQALHGLGQDVGAGVPVRLAVLLVFKRVDVFFAHDMFLLVIGAGQKQSLTPEWYQG